MKWVDVNDRLPDYEQHVLVYGKRIERSPQMGGNQPVVIIVKRQDLKKSSIRLNDRQRFQDKNEFSYMEDVTHWQPLPSAPGTEKESDGGYWEKRCEAAEAYANYINDNCVLDIISNKQWKEKLYKEWQQLKSQQPI